MYLFIFPPSYVSLWDSKTRHRPAGECFLVFGNFSLFLRLPSRDGSPSLPLLSLFLSFIFCLTSFQRQWAAFGCLMSSASIQKLFCGICSAFKCSFDELVEEKVVSLSYSSTILGPSHLSLKACKEFGSFNHKLPQFPCLASCSKTILSYFTQTPVSRFSSVPMYRDPVSTTLCSCIKILHYHKNTHSSKIAMYVI